VEKLLKQLGDLGRAGLPRAEAPGLMKIKGAPDWAWGSGYVHRVPALFNPRQGGGILTDKLTFLCESRTVLCFFIQGVGFWFNNPAIHDARCTCAFILEPYLVRQTS
jgi:hypothetical protein